MNETTGIIPRVTLQLGSRQVEIKKRNQIGLALNGATENNKEDPNLMGSNFQVRK
jgi:hypothetical protein